MKQHRFRKLRTLLLLGTTLLLGGCGKQWILLHPAGPIAAHEKNLILTAWWLMVLVALPVFVLTIWFAWHYRASNKKANYQPNWDFSWSVDALIWVLPLVGVAILAFLCWTSTQSLAPYKPIASKKAPVEVDVVAFDWKWLFIYPKQHIATVNQLVIPVGHPINFKLTSDTVMTSFFIPEMGSQIYAMSGMRTRLNLIADKPGTYHGQNMQFSGRGYADMNFKVLAKQDAGFQDWVASVQKSDKKFDMTALAQLQKRTIANPVAHYGSVKPQMFQTILDQYRYSHHDGNRPGA
ncbi:MAG: ubiquinol oxidase subunit II [Gammaproteobacteria bacterium]